MKHLFLIPLFFIIMFFSCRKNNNLEETLRLSGKNRSELEQVLTHYKDDHLKLKAAQFLIENMSGHYSYAENNSDIMAYYTEIDSVYELYKGLTRDSLIIFYENIARKYDLSKVEIIPDEQCISANFLINNIEQSFTIWQNSPWAKHINFEDFCEYILPYKTSEYQILDNWREYLRNICNGDIDTLQYCSLYKNLAVKACETVNLELKKHLATKIILAEKILPVMKIDIAMKKPLGTCDEYAMIATTVLRAKGIPTCIDYTPQWPFRSMGHTWNVVLNNFGKNIIFSGCDTKVGIPHKIDHPMAKVFRQTYAINYEIKELNFKERYVPVTFKNYHVKDVTEEYMSPIDVKINIIEKTGKFQYAYLAVFDNQNWIPIQFGKIKRNTVVFSKMGKGIVYLPVAYGIKGIEPIANPFILNLRGEYIELIPNFTDNQTLILDRKYPVLSAPFNVAKRILNAKIQASNDPHFNKELITVHTIKELGPKYGKIRIDSLSEKYQYWRCLSPSAGCCNIAELYFFSKDSSQPIYGQIIGTSGAWHNQQLYAKEVVFDNNPLTYFHAPVDSVGWVGMDFGKPISMDKIIYLPRGDGNGVLFGNEYELFYWDKNRWQSLGRKTPSDIELIYENCPNNALFLLRNYTLGKDERIFTYENGKQVWW